MTVPSCICGTCSPCRRRVVKRDAKRRRSLEMGTARKRLPIAPLLEVSTLEELRHHTSAQIYFWNRRGWLNESQADRVALAIGYHPCEIWTEQWFLGCDV